MTNESYQNPYSNYPSISSRVARFTPAAIMRRQLSPKSNDQKHDEIALKIAIIEEKIERILSK